MPDISLHDAIYSQRAIRKFQNYPVSEELVYQVLDAAIRAPSGGNRQPWVFIVIRDTNKKQQISELYKRSFEQAYGSTGKSQSLGSQVYSSASYLSDHMSESPVLILACVQHDGSASSMSRGSSIYPAVQNLMLVARSFGLGTVITTLHKRYEDEIKKLLKIPADVETAALIPMGYPGKDEHFGGSRRIPVKSVAFRDTWGEIGL
ncbi:hypothetical protein FIM02_02990 [SAR202 cluster bacterium AD-802-E10_MRT_200m]|nr:hypothetical protein [SAR202 cluster bacterium AD-802-E10_MRT_200m]